MTNDGTRFEQERAFWDRHVEQVWGGVEDYQMPRLAPFEELCGSIAYLGPVLEFVGSVKDKRVLDLACGDGWLSWSLAKSGAMVAGCDISPGSIEVAAQVARANGLQSRLRFDAMICEKLAYEDNQFDLVLMHAAMHHCDIDQVSKEIWRVLKPGGRAVLIEDYAYHPLMNLYRRLTPASHTPEEEALTDEDLAVIASRFSYCEYKFFGLVNLVETSCHPLMVRLKPVLRAVDGYLYKRLPRAQKYSKLVEVFLVK